MKCYRHNDTDAVGSCKTCNKGLCHECAFDTSNGLACKDTCIDEVCALNETIERSKKIYGIGTKPSAIPAGALVYFMFALLFGGWGVYSTVKRGEWDTFPIVMGIGMLVIGVVTYIRSKRLNLNC